MMMMKKRRRAWTVSKTDERDDKNITRRRVESWWILSYQKNCLLKGVENH